MSRKTARLTVDALAELDEHARTCLFWQLDPVARSRVEPGQESTELEGWVSEVLRDWGSCGRMVIDGHPVGVALYGPDTFFPGASVMPTAPSSPDAVLLASVYVSPDHRGRGFGRMLVQSVAADLVSRGFSAIEAFASTPAARPDECVLPRGFAECVGFKTHRKHPAYPRMRMDLRTTRAWRSEMESAWERLVEAVRPAQQWGAQAPRSTHRTGVETEMG